MSEKKNNSLDYYFDDINKCITLSSEEINEKIQEINSTFTLYQDLLLGLPGAGSYIIQEWRRIRDEGRLVCKMLEAYTQSDKENDQISNLVNNTMRKVILLDEEEDREEIKSLLIELKLSKQLLLEIGPLVWVENNITNDEFESMASYLRIIETLQSQIVESNLKLVIRFAKEYQNVGVPLADLIQEGNIGLIRAVEKFDPTQNIKFVTYAVWWIKQGFLKIIKHSNKLIRTPTYVQETLSRIAKLRTAYENEMGVEPTLEYLAEQEGMTEEELEILYNVSMDPISLDAITPDFGEHQKTLKDFLPDPDVDLDKTLDSFKLSEGILKALDSHLTPFEKEVMVLRYGLFNETAHTLEESAAKLNKSREHIRQLDASGLAKLKALAPELKDFRE